MSHDYYYDILGYTKAAVKTGGSTTSFKCVACSDVVASGSYDGSSFDCSLASNIGVPICGTNAFPVQSGAIYECECNSGYIEDSAGNCILCSDVFTAESFTAGTTTAGNTLSKLLTDTSTASACACVTNAKPDVTSKKCACNTGSIESSDFFNTGNDGKACIVQSSLTNVVSGSSPQTCGLNAYIDESGQCMCPTTSNSVAGTVLSDYVVGSTNNFCYRQNTAPECVQDDSSSTKGLISVSCSSGGFVLTLNEVCRSTDFNFLDKTKFYIGDTSDSSCNLAVGGGTNPTVTVAFGSCLTTNAAGGTGTIHTAVLKFHRNSFILSTRLPTPPLDNRNYDLTALTKS